MNASGGEAKAVEGSARAAWERSLRGPGILLVLLVQAALALSAQRGRVFLDDEVGTWHAVQGSFGTILTRFDEWQTQPAYFLLAKLASLVLGENAFALRLPALLAALGLTLATACLARLWFGARTGLVAGALIALHPFVLFYAQMARGYTLALALTVTSLLLTLRMARGAGGPRTGVCLVLARAFGVYAHLGAAATLPAEVLLAFLVARERGRPRREAWRVVAWVAAGALLALALYGPMIPGMLAFRARWTGAEQGGFSLGFVPLVARTYGGGRLAGLVLLSAMSLLGLAHALRHRAPVALVLGTWCLGVPAFYALLNTAHYPWAFARFLVPLLPGLALLAAHGLVLATARLPARAALALALALPLGLAYRDDVELAFGARDANLALLFEAIAKQNGEAERGLVVLMPVRFHCFEPFEARIARTRQRPVRFEELPALLARGGAEPLFQGPVTFLVDLVPADELRALGAFDVSEHGSTTRLDLRQDPVASPAERARAALAATRAVALALARFLEPFEGKPQSGPWVFWRLDPRHEHVYSATKTHAAARALVAVTAGLLGDASTAAAEEARALSLMADVPAPGAIGSRFP